ncbi:M23 family metallopeptidase [Sphingobacterium sp. LRF_L2]|uniref:M23 family metallopeptidase n=1 Tax=Sphingobacterium sp. LRF_L2 TaxID=3369421 RepID=UPI003F609280
MLKKKTAVLFVEQDGTSTKRLQIPTVVVLHWKKITGFLLTLITLAIISLIFFVRQQTNEQYVQYDKKINLLNEQKKRLELDGANNELTTEEMKKSFNSIDSTLERINQKMRRRGLKEIKIKNVGGPIEKEENLVELSVFYKKQLKNLEAKLEGMPLGRPHAGRITSPFGYRRNPFTNRGREMHAGVDLKGRTGDPVKATAKGQVTFAGYKGDYGYVVMVKHNNGYETRYAHLTRTRVKKGERIEAGEIVGLLGSTGRSTGSHLHYEVIQNDHKLDPEKYFTL